MKLLPRKPVPELDLPITDGSRFVLSRLKPENFTLLVVYRGLHCPLCKDYLEDLEKRIPDFAAKGVIPVAVSSDQEERAHKAKVRWSIDKLTLAYGMTIEEGRRWGLNVSNARIDKEPAQFLEPGLFLIRPDMTLYASSIQTMPFARPHFEDIAQALKWVILNDYPARGEAPEEVRA